MSWVLFFGSFTSEFLFYACMPRSILLLFSERTEKKKTYFSWSWASFWRLFLSFFFVLRSERKESSSCSSFSESYFLHFERVCSSLRTPSPFVNSFRVSFFPVFLFIIFLRLAVFSSVLPYTLHIEPLILKERKERKKKKEKKQPKKENT